MESLRGGDQHADRHGHRHDGVPVREGRPRGRLAIEAMIAKRGIERDGELARRRQLGRQRGLLRLAIRLHDRTARGRRFVERGDELGEDRIAVSGDPLGPERERRDRARQPHERHAELERHRATRHRDRDRCGVRDEALDVQRGLDPRELRQPRVLRACGRHREILAATQRILDEAGGTADAELDERADPGRVELLDELAKPHGSNEVLDRECADRRRLGRIRRARGR